MAYLRTTFTFLLNINLCYAVLLASVYFTITQYLQNLSPATADRVRAGAAEIGFQVENFGRPIGILLGLGFSVRILVLLCLSRLERKIK